MTRTGGLATQQLGRTHGVKAAPALARVRCAQPYIDLVLIRRIANGRDKLSDVEVREVGGSELGRLRRDGRKRILVGGHFGYFAGVVLMSRLGPVEVGQAPGELAVDGPGLKRFQLRDRNSREALAHCEEVRLVSLPHSDAGAAARGALTMLRTVRRSGAHCALALDPPWPAEHALSRRWAGRRERRFPLGVEQLARATGAEVTMVVMRLAGDGVVEFHWGTTQRVDPSEPRGTLMERLLDELEPYVGRFPENYTLDIGSERRWDGARGRWVD